MATELIGHTGRATKQFLYLGALSEAISDVTETRTDINFEFTKKQTNSERGSDQRKKQFSIQRQNNFHTSDKKDFEPATKVQPSQSE